MSTPAKGSPQQQEPTQVVPRQYTQGEKARITRYVERLGTKSVEFQKPKSRSKRKHLECVNSQEAFTKVQLAEALGSADADFQVHAIDQIVATFPGVLPNRHTDSATGIPIRGTSRLSPTDSSRDTMIGNGIPRVSASG